jgi:hypothetical protein
MADPDDMTERYNTPLSPAEEKNYQSWAKKAGRDRDVYDYDMRGAWKQGITADRSGHFPDTYKKPNHPTFSNESIYHGRDGHFGGYWDQDETGSETLHPYDPRLKFAQGGAVLPRTGGPYLKGRNRP